MGLIESIYNNPLRIKIAEFLSSDFLVKGFDVWNFVHLLSGFTLMFFIKKFKLDKKWKVNKFLLILAGLILFELLELYFFIIGSQFFIAESKFNQFLDIMVGMIGAWIFSKRYG